LVILGRLTKRWSKKQKFLRTILKEEREVEIEVLGGDFQRLGPWQLKASPPLMKQWKSRMDGRKELEEGRDPKCGRAEKRREVGEKQGHGGI